MTESIASAPFGPIPLTPSTYNLYQEGDSVIIDLLTIYDKGEISNISDEFISFLLDKRKNG